MDITVQELIDRLKIEPPDSVLHFGGLDFYRVKNRGAGCVQIEFSETVYKDDDGKIVIINC